MKRTLTAAVLILLAPYVVLLIAVDRGRRYAARSLRELAGKVNPDG